MNKPFEKSDTNYQPMLDMALARIRQLSAHEVGHTIGFAHNFAASPNGRASVMDYPHPTLRLKNGEVNFSNAYATGIGEWDKVTVAYSYGIVPDGVVEKEYLNTILETAEKKGLRYITDSDARAQGGAHYKAHLWDNGGNASSELNDLLKLRKQAIANFSIDNIRTNEPYSVLEDVFVPLYFYHRYQTEAAVKMIGGLNYNYAVKGDSQLEISEVLDIKAQQQALATVLQTLTADELAIPEDKLALFPPRAHGYNRTRESFKSKTGVAFDALGVAATASDMTLSLLLHPERANRLIQQKALDSKQLGLQEVLQELIDETLMSKEKNSYKKEVQNTINYNVVKHLINLYVHPNSIPQTKATAKYMLRSIVKSSLGSSNIHDIDIRDQIEKVIDKPETFKALSSPKIPDGSPIGCFQE